jgi:AraC-like DNA-binding protein
MVQMLTFDSDDLGETEDFLSRAYTRMVIGGAPERTRTRMTRHVVGPVSVDRLAFDHAMRYAADAPDRILLCHLRSGDILRRYRPDGPEGLSGPGDVFACTPRGRRCTGEFRWTRCHLAVFDGALLTQVAAAAPGRRPGPVELTGGRPVSPAAARNLRNTLDYLLHGVCADPELGREPLLVSAAVQCLAAAVLSAFPNTALSEPTAADRGDAHPAGLRRAVAFIDGNAHREITVADVAEAAHISIRTLQTAFRRHLQITPTGYLRRVRLAGVHADLLAAVPGPDVRVTALAARWGFFQPGQFAADYRLAYGRLPHQTLHGRQG